MGTRQHLSKSPALRLREGRVSLRSAAVVLAVGSHSSLSPAGPALPGDFPRLELPSRSVSLEPLDPLSCGCVSQPA